MATTLLAAGNPIWLPCIMYYLLCYDDFTIYVIMHGSQIGFLAARMVVWSRNTGITTTIMQVSLSHHCRFFMLGEEEN